LPGRCCTHFKGRLSRRAVAVGAPKAAKPIYEADRHAKKELKKRVRGVRPIERAAEGTRLAWEAVITYGGQFRGFSQIMPSFGQALTPDQIQEVARYLRSFCTNPHKWMGVNFDCDLFWVADRAALLGALSILPEYLRTAAGEAGAVIDYRDWQIPLGRRFRSLKLWFTLRCDGVAPIQSMIRDHVGWTQELAGWVAADDRFEIVAPHPLDLVCFAHRGGDEATDAMIAAANASGAALFTRSVSDGRTFVRVCVGGRMTERRHVEAAWALLQSTASTLP
jgi:hypothetical protein